LYNLISTVFVSNWYVSGYKKILTVYREPIVVLMN
jgi:hypothetical protein